MGLRVGIEEVLEEAKRGSQKGTIIVLGIGFPSYEFSLLFYLALPCLFPMLLAYQWMMEWRKQQGEKLICVDYLRMGELGGWLHERRGPHNCTNLGHGVSLGSH